MKGTGDEDWARANYQALAAWAHEMLEADRNGNGLVEYPGSGNFGDRPTRSRRPSNWWDTINFGHEDAFSNALARLSLGVAIAFNELQKRGAFDGLGAEKH